MGWHSLEWGLRHISASELQEWIEFFSVEGFESDRQEARNAQAITMIVNSLTPITGNKIENPIALVRDVWGDTRFEEQPQEELISNLEFLRVVIGRKP